MGDNLQQQPNACAYKQFICFSQFVSPLSIPKPLTLPQLLQVWNLEFKLYVYKIVCPKMAVETLMIEHFGVHHKEYKPSPTLGL